MTDPDPRLRFRFYVEGVVVDEVWVNAEAPGGEAEVGKVSARHMDMADKCERDRALWLAEVYDPDQPPEHGYVRFGSDPRGMDNPQPVAGMCQRCGAVITHPADLSDGWCGDCRGRYAFRPVVTLHLPGDGPPGPGGTP